ncbi:hypothetical protein HETIRDRAFT_45747 [Heterobasidion irregulare TC 32-1]|uniref:Reverse transcriptase domain-containing protein n=1 Tax=Heterobasidion irregulare (strain TC 32-1) TaxID=747525 RepID=W4KAG9_HETIT|nr:uncharacterized protein HETIRDRAFT_45747 [Heterobasidion irregulare TC 32-1]ETW82086.1 hypothetical protein HETIRDRAFT_45747 [Heterobasidion irregulare TC 32-1]
MYFLLMNVNTRYNNALIEPKSRKLAAFIINLGMYKPLVIFFRLTNFLATFQIMINALFKDLIYIKKMTIYMDNILVFSKTMENYFK